MRSVTLLLALAIVSCGADSSPRLGAGLDTDVVFALDRMLDYHLTIDPVDLANLDNITYVHGKFRCGRITLDDVGVRYKGNSSYRNGAPKYSFKVDFNRYVSGQTFRGLKKLNFNNNFKDPSLMRERLGYHLHRAAGVTAGRTAHANLYVNDVYMGVYTVVEQVDKTFLRDRFGNDTGNLYKADYFCNLEWRGPNPAIYQLDYTLKTNETQNDWSRFIHLVDILNNTPPAGFPAAIESVFNVDPFLSWLAVDALLSHLDNYSGRSVNYYLYDNPGTGKFEFIPWDLNEVFGNFRGGWTADEILLLDIYRPFMRNPPVSPARPLVERLLAVPEYRTAYEDKLRALIAGPFSQTAMDAEIDAIFDLIQADVLNDTMKPFTNLEFMDSIVQDIPPVGPMRTLGLKPFVAARTQDVQNQLP